MAPYGITEQTTFLDLGEKVPKNRLTHDQYFWFSSGKYLNKRIPQYHILPLIYFHCLLITIKYVHALRRANIYSNIVIAKYDSESAYRRGLLSGKLSEMCMAMVSGISLLSLRLTFGRSFCPFPWCLIMEITTDLENDLLLCDVWEPHH